MVLQAHLKKHIIALGGWLLMYTSGPPPGLAKDQTFSGFFATFPYFKDVFPMDTTFLSKNFQQKRSPLTECQSKKDETIQNVKRIRLLEEVQQALQANIIMTIIIIFIHMDITIMS